MIRGRIPLGRAFAVVCIAGAWALPLAAEQWDKEWYWKGVPYVPTPQVIVDAMLDLADVTKADVVYDLGSGDQSISGQRRPRSSPCRAKSTSRTSRACSWNAFPESPMTFRNRIKPL